MSEKLFDALETCLHALEQGETIDTALARFPALTGELRPILEASLHARTLGGSAVPGDVQRRGRARLLQNAAKMREAKRVPRRTWLFNLRPLAVALMLVIIFLSSTGLVNASTTSLPGDNLYPVKRTWEDVRLIFASTEDEREGLEMEYENERLEEISELLFESRVESVSFSGYVTAQTDGQWVVSGIPVTISGDTVLPGDPITVGSVVTVFGVTTSDGILQAQSIVMVPPGTPIPTPKPEEEDDTDNEGDEEGSGGNSGQETGSDSSSNDNANDSDDDSDSGKDSKLEGTVQSMDGNVWIINGQTVNVSGAEIVGTPAPGATVTVEGYVNADGVFIATKVIFGGGGGDGNSGSGDDSPDDNTDNDDDENNEDNSGSGGGGGDDDGDDD